MNAVVSQQELFEVMQSLSEKQPEEVHRKGWGLGSEISYWNVEKDATKSPSSLPQPVQPIPEEQPEEVFSVKWGSASDMPWQLDDTKSAIYKYLLEYGRKEFPSHKKTLKQLKNNLARLKDEDQLRETLTGVTEERSSPFHALIAEVASHVIVATVRLKLPGLRKFFTDGIGKHVLNSVERKHSCLIEILDDKTRADLSDEIQTCFDSALAEFERISDVFKTHMGSPEVVDENVWRERSWKRTFPELSEDSSRSTWIKNTQICVCMGDVTKEMTDSLLIMNTNTLELKKGGQLNKDIDRTAGPSVRKECKRIISRDGAQLPGNIVMTGAGDLPCKNLIHVIAYPGSSQILDLQMSVKMGLKFADERGMGSIVLPAIGAGAMGLSPTNSARVLTRAILSFLESPPRTIREIRIVLFDESLLSTFHDEMKNEFAPIQALEGFFPLSMPPKEEDCITAMTPVDVAFHEGYGNTPPIATAEFRVYGKDKKCVTTVINSLRGKFVKYCTVQKVTHQEVPRLIQSCWAWLRHLGSKHDTDLKKDEHNSTIVVSGNWDDVCLVVSCIRQKIDRLIENQQVLEKRKLMAQYVQWHYVILDREIAVNEKVSSTIEEAWTKKQDGVAFCMSNNTYKVDFKSMTVVSSDMKYPPLRLSRKLHTETGVVTPDSWSTQPYFADGKPVPVTTFPLPEMEYQSVANMFYSTGGAGTIVRIDRVQNPCLYTQYITYKQDVEQKNSRSGRIVRNELQLFHGTKGSNVSAINRHGFNRTFAGTTHGAAFGNGVYFASRASYSKGYTAPDSNGLRHMYLARVVVGFYTLGQRGLLVPPAIPCHEPEVLFDSVVDNTENPAVFVVFRDAQCYPEYLITFKT